MCDNYCFSEDALRTQSKVFNCDMVLYYLRNYAEEGEELTKGEKQWKGAEEQIKRYAAAPRVEALRQGTQLHKIIMQFEGWKLRKMDEVE